MRITLSTGATIDRLPPDAETAALVVSIDDDAYLGGYGHPLAALTNIGGYAYLGEYAHGDNWPWLINGGADRRGYYFTGILKAGEWRIRAGCRDFSIKQALRHWGSGGNSDKPDCFALVEKIVAETVRRAAVSVAA